MSSKTSNNFFQPVISTFGLAISLITSILPLFSNEVLTKMFINRDLAQPISFMAFMIGIAIIWQITEFQPDIKINLIKREKYDHLIKIKADGIIWLLLIVNVIVGSLFFYIGNSSFDNNKLIYEIIQACFYLLFFLSLISVFAILFSQTKKRFKEQEDRENFPFIIFETLERNRLIKPYIEIYENRKMSFEEIKNENIGYRNNPRKITIKTSVQKKEKIKFIVSDDGKEIYKILKKNEISETD